MSAPTPVLRDYFVTHLTVNFAVKANFFLSFAVRFIAVIAGVLIKRINLDVKM